MPAATLLFLVPVACLSAFVQSFSGFGGGLLAIPLYTLVLPPQSAVPINFLLMFFLYPLLLWETRQHICWKNILPFLLPAAVALPLGAFCLVYLPGKLLRLFISLSTLLFSFLFFFNVKFPFRDRMAFRVVTGLLSGFLGGSISQSGPPVVIWGLSCGWGKDRFRSTLLTYFFLLSLTGIFSYLSLGLFSPEILRVVLRALFPAILFCLLGLYLKRRTRENVFRHAILMVIILVSLLNIWSLFSSGKKLRDSTALIDSPLLREPAEKEK